MKYLKSVFHEFVFGNYFIALCALSMIFTTLLLCNLPLTFSPATIFVTVATYLLYNFHRHSFYIDYSDFGAIVSSIKKINFKYSEVIVYCLAFITFIIYFFKLNERIYPYLIPLGLLALSYSAPIMRSKGKKFRLKEVFFIKTPVIALVWALTTTVIPLVEQNISILSTFVIWQIVSRTLFIFALCIPFEMRDMNIDRKNNISTIAVAHGRRQTQIIGVVIILVELLTHHFFEDVSAYSKFALDLSSVIALSFILFQNSSRSGYYYKFFVDGTMVLRFIFLLLITGPL